MFLGVPMFGKLTFAILAFVATLAFEISGTTAAFADNWVKLATRDIDLARGQDSIDLRSAKGKYKALRIYARRHKIFLDNVRIVYALGRVHNEDRGITLLPGERTRPINATPSGRFINRIDLRYEPDPRAKRPARLIIWGLQADEDANAQRLRDKIRDKVAVIRDKAFGGSSANSAGGNSAGGSGDKPDPVIESDSGTVLFGLKTVGFGTDHDVIEVGRKIGKFDKIRLRVKNNDIHLTALKVVFGNGSSKSFPYDDTVKAGTRSRWLELDGDRFIERIELDYRSKPNFRGRARIEVFGEYAEDWLSSGGKGQNYNHGWVYLGGQSPLFFSIRKGLGYEKDTVEVGRNKGGFRTIRVDVKNRAITLREMTVVYGDGTIDIIPVKKKISSGESYGPIDLQGEGKRAIKEIQVRYRSRIFDSKAKSNSHAFVEFWGKH